MDSLRQYKKDKIKLLEHDFLVHMTQEQKNHLNALTTEISIDNYALKLIFDFIDGRNS